MYNDLLGIKFKPHGRSKEEGFDCYGLAIEVLAREGITLQDMYYDSLKQGEDRWNDFNSRLTKINRPEKNCIVELLRKDGTNSHIAVYIGEGLIIHAIVNIGVAIEPLRHYQDRIGGYYYVNR